MSFEQDLIDVTFKGPIPEWFELFRCGSYNSHPLVEYCETSFVVINGYAEPMVNVRYHKLVVSEGVEVRLIVDQIEATFPCDVKYGAKMRLLCKAQPNIRHVRVEFHGYQLPEGVVGGGDA